MGNPSRRIQSAIFSTALCTALALGLSLSACSPDPKSVPDQVSILKKSKSDRQKVAAVERLKDIGTDEAKEAMVKALSQSPRPTGKVLTALAKTLGEMKVTAAAQALAEAIDFSAGSGSDPSTVDANNANKEIARTLGDLGDARVANEVGRLLRASQDNYVRIEAINALGKFKDPSTAEVLIDLATDDRVEAFLNKKALIALGEMKSQKALDTFVWMLFYERRGTSFFPEAAMGVFRLGSTALKPLLSILDGTATSLLAKAKEEKLNPAAMTAKTAQVLGDLGDSSATPALLKLLKYENEDDLRAQYFVRMAAADSLGRLRAKEAIKPLQAMLSEEEATARQTYIRALFMIGDTSTVKKITPCATKDHWLLRDVCMYGLAMLSPKKDAKLFDGFAKNTKKLFTRDCEEYDLFGDIDCATEGDKDLKIIRSAMEGYRDAVATACGRSDFECLVENLKNGRPKARERAAYDLGRLGGVRVVAPLLEAIHRPMEKDDEVAPRFAAILALDWATRQDGTARAKAREDIPNLTAQIEREKNKRVSQASAEDVQRLILKLERE